MTCGGTSGGLAGTKMAWPISLLLAFLPLGSVSVADLPDLKARASSGDPDAQVSLGIARLADEAAVETLWRCAEAHTGWERMNETGACLALMAAMAATAWVWSGMPTVAASIFFSISSNILRKSRYCLASGKSFIVPARRRSTSHKATRLLPGATPRMSPPPMPRPRCLRYSAFRWGACGPARRERLGIRPTAAQVRTTTKLA